MTSGEELINEFMTIKFDLIFEGYQYTSKEPFNDFGDIEHYDDFDIIFKKRFKCHSNICGELIIMKLQPNEEYLEYLNKLRYDFYLEINEALIKEPSSFKLVSVLLDYKNIFNELLANYSDDKHQFSRLDNNSTIGSAIYKHNNRLRYYFDNDNASPNRLFLLRATDSYLTCQTNTIEFIISFLDERIELLKTLPKDTLPSRSINSGKSRITPVSTEIKSFTFNFVSTKSAEINEKLQEFKESLLRYGLIEQIDVRYLHHIFSNQEIEQPVKWLGTPGELYYLIRQLYDQNIIIRFKNYWSIACKCFLAYDKRGNLCTPYYLQRCKPPTRGEQLRRLNSIIDTLR